MQALYVRKHADVQRGDTCVIAEDAPLLASAPGGSPASLYRQPPDGLFERAVVDSTLPLRDSAWSRALLGRVHRAVRPGGEVSVPLREGEGMLALRELLGDPLESGPEHATFRRVELPEAPSLLEWFVDASAELALDLVALGSLTAAERYALLRDVAAPYLRNVVGERATVDWDPPTELEQACYLVRYWAWGLSYKAPLLAAILRRHFAGRGDLRVADVGAGPGWVAAELLVDPASGVASAVNVDLSPGYALVARKMYDRYAARLAGRFTTDVAPMEGFGEEEGFDAVSFLGGTLTYIPRSSRLPVLEAAWSSLRAGGLLVVLENIRSPRFGTVQEQMFDAAELDALVGRFGPVSYFSSQSGAAVPTARVGDKTVFRVVRKG